MGKIQHDPEFKFEFESENCGIQFLYEDDGQIAFL